MPRIFVFAIVALCTAPLFCQDAPLSAAVFLKQGEAAYKAGRFSESANLYARALPLVGETDRSGLEYNLACSQALAGDHGAAIVSLGDAIEDGYADRKNAEADKDLLSLHSDPKWQALLARISTLSDQQDRRWGDRAFDTPYSPNLSDSDKVAGLSELWAQAKYGFANFWHVPQLDWDQTYRDFLPQVLATHSTTEYYRVLQRFYAQLGDGHTGVYSPDQLQGKVDRLALRTRLVDGHLLVIGARDPKADLQGVRPGDEITTINGEPAQPWAGENVAPFVSASTLQDRDTRTFEYVLFLAAVGTTFEVGTESPSGQKATHSFKVVKEASAHLPLFAMRRLPGDVVYVALNGFDDDTAAKEWDKHWAEINSAKGIILDLRENGGGDQSVGNQILATLIAKPVPGELSRSTRWIATYRAWGDAQTPMRFPVGTVDLDPKRRFSGPVVLLTSPRTYSAGEDMVVVFAQAHRGKIIGEPTGGSTGQPLMFKLPGGGLARVCTKHDSFADGREFVGVGIQPDVPVSLTRTDIVAGKDSVLEAAVHSLQGP